MSDAILEWDGFDVMFSATDERLHVVKSLSLCIKAGECLAIVGESGSGKTQSVMAPFGLSDGAIMAGRVWFEKLDLIVANELEKNDIRGRKVGFVFQDPMTSLAPHLTIGEQLAISLTHHCGLSKRDATSRCVELLEAVKMSEPRLCLGQYPHELSGGMRQRAMLAMAISCDPILLVADEPTTALDAAVQVEILSLLNELRKSRSMALLVISHDFGVVASIADRIAVMHQGRCVEVGDASAVLSTPRDSYTQLLLQAAKATQCYARVSDAQDAVLEIANATVKFRTSSGFFSWRAREPTVALNDVSLQLFPGEALGVVGESGSGKSTLLNVLIGKLKSTGVVRLNGHDRGQKGSVSLTSKLDVQLVFQDATSSFDPCLTIGKSISIAVRQRNPGWSADDVNVRVHQLLKSCGLDVTIAHRWPSQLSGGQNQRAAIARALATEPKILACDEAVSALDVTIRTQVLDLLIELMLELDLAIIFITHDMGVVRHLCARVLVIQNGRVVERGLTCEVLSDPREEYTRKLLNSVLTLT